MTMTITIKDEYANEVKDIVKSLKSAKLIEKYKVDSTKKEEQKARLKKELQRAFDDIKDGRYTTRGLVGEI